MNDESAKLTPSAEGGEDFDVLVMLYLDDLLDDEQLLSLRSRLHESEDCRDRFVAICSQSGQLREGFATQQLGGEEQLPEPAGRLRAVAARLAERARAGVSYLARPMAVSLLAAGLSIGALLGLLAWQSVPSSTTSPAIAQQPAEARFAARVIWARDCQWEEGMTELEVGSFLREGETLAVAAGLVEVAFDDGARLLVEGPSQLVVTSSASARLHSGRVTGYVPPRAVGFAVATPQCEVVDLGTEFGLTAMPETATEVHVFAGAVRVDLQSAENRRIVRANEAVRVSADSPGQIAGTSFVGQQFVRSSIAREVQDIAPVEWITANFDSAGGADGWLTPWNIYGAGRVARSLREPLEHNGNAYLQASLTAKESCLRRTYGKYGEVDPSQPHVIRWKWRFDGDARALTNFHDRIHFFADKTPIHGSTHSNAWLIGVAHGVEGGRQPLVGRWYFFDSSRSGKYDSEFHRRNMVDTGMALKPGAVYEFEAVVDPQQGTYAATIDDGEEKFTAADLHFRNGESGEYPVLHFGGCASATGEVHAFSLDSIEIRGMKSIESDKGEPLPMPNTPPNESGGES